MAALSQPIPFIGPVQTYAWGGYDYIAALTGREKAIAEEPWAELWMGAHPKGPGVSLEGKLNELIAANPNRFLGTSIAARFENRLPYLLKILDVREMLSIQAHPTKAAAEVGFAREEQDGPEITAPNRNYRDRNHKPELGVALSDFYLLHGFRPAKEIEESLASVPGWDELRPVYSSEGVKGLYRHVMELSQEAVDRLLAPLAKRLSASVLMDKDQVDFWAKRAFEQYDRNGHHDRGIFSVYWFNLVHLRPGQGIFQDAGIPHAYLEGACIELMANSDNVLRGGLTVKHIDVPELLKHLRFDAVSPHILRPSPTSDSWETYETPAPDFRLSRKVFSPEETISEAAGPAVYFIFEGRLSGDSVGDVETGASIFLPQGAELQLKATEKSIIYRASPGEPYSE